MFSLSLCPGDFIFPLSVLGRGSDGDARWVLRVPRSVAVVPRGSVQPAAFVRVLFIVRGSV